MGLTGVHFLLTYRCTHECDHCFVFSSPRAAGVFTGERLADAIDQCVAPGTVEWVFFEGGEPFLYYPLLQHGIERAARHGFKVGIVTNGYWATSVDDGVRALEGLARLDLLQVSQDDFHGVADGPVHAIAAARRLGIQRSVIRVEDEDVMFRGRAVDKLVSGRPRQPASCFDACPHEALDAPGRVHVDSYGFVQICQGISIGNVFETPLSEIMETYARNPEAHPVLGPLLRGGPRELAAALGFNAEARAGFVDACHLCFMTRRGAKLKPEFVYTGA